MYYRVTRLKRFKLLKLILNITSFPIRFPIFLSFIIIGKLAEILAIILDVFDRILYWIMDSISKIFKFKEIADKQHEENKDKFKTDY